MNEQTNTDQFHVGGYYRNGYGEVVRLVNDPSWARNGYPFCSVLSGSDPRNGVRASHRLSDGSTSTGREKYALIPGELNAQGEPIAPTFYCAAETIKPKLDAGHQPRVVKEKVFPRLTWADSKPFDAFKDFASSSDTATPDHAYSHPLTRVADAGAQVLAQHGSAHILPKA